MELEVLKNLITPFLLIGFGLFIKVNKNFISVKKWWKMIVVIGLISLILKVLNMLL